jgi:diguanylate cyclase (GGDEF)-like protein
VESAVASTDDRRSGLAGRLLPLRHWLGARHIEQGQKHTRLVCTLVGLIGFVVAGRYAVLPDGIVATAILFPLYAIGYAVYEHLHPVPTRAGRGFALLADNLVASYIASFGGLFAAYVGFNFLTTVGWGLRFGRHYLFLATAIVIAAMACNLALSPYWQAQLLFGGSIIFGLLANTLNASILLRRIAAANRDLAQKMEQISRLAWQDPLTRVPNRMYFHEHLAQALAAAARSRRRLALLLFDIDGFKSVNDTLGHEAGDRLLQEIAARVARRVRQADTFARLGGDEFVVLMELGHDTAAASAVAESIIQVVGDIDIFADRGLRVGVSIGIACCAPQPSRPQDPDELLKRADGAMYEAKRAGKGCYRLAEQPAADGS